jgi:hypothetical protein
MNTFDGLDVLDAELARRLAECEEHLRAVVSDYRALVQTALFGALEPDLRSQIATAIRSYVARGTERLQTAKAAIDAIRSLDSACALHADPLAGIAPTDSAPAPAPLQPSAVVSRLREPQSQSRRAPKPPADEEAEFEDVLPPEELNEDAEDERAAKQMAVTTRIPNDQEPEVLPPELRVEAPPSAPRSWAGAGEGRPKPKPPRGSAAPVRGDGFRRSAPEQAAAAEQTERIAARRHKSGADIRPVSQEEMLTGVRPSEADPGDGGGGVVSSNRPTSPDAHFDATHKRVKEQQRRNIAAKSEAETARLANVVLREAALVDELGNTVGRASTVLKDGNLLTAEQIEVFLDSLEGLNPSAEDPAAALQAIMKARSAFHFEGPDEGMPALRAMISYAKECAFADDDPGVLVLQGVGLARR